MISYPGLQVLNTNASASGEQALGGIRRFSKKDANGDKSMPENLDDISPQKRGSANHTPPLVEPIPLQSRAAGSRPTGPRLQSKSLDDPNDQTSPARPPHYDAA